MWINFLSVTLAMLSATSFGVDANERLCGRQLADALDYVCTETGFHWEVNRRSGMPAISKRSTFGRSTRRRGVVQECCHNICTIDTLQMYCAGPASNTRLSVLRQHFRIDATPSTWQPVTLPPSPPSSDDASTPSSQLATNPRKSNSFFYLHVGPRPTRSPLI